MPGLLATLLFCLALSPARTSAQDPASGDRRVRASFGLARGQAALTCHFCTGAEATSAAGLMGVERALRQNVRLGVQLHWWLHFGDGLSRSVAAATAVSHFRPFRRPLVLTVGSGVGRYASSDEEDDLRTATVVGVLAVGYELRSGGEYVVVPYVSQLGGTGGTMRLNGATVTPWSGLSLWQVGVAVTTR